MIMNSPAITAQQLDQLKTDFALTDGDLDDLVRDVFDDHAADVNNRGIDDQLAECQTEGDLDDLVCDAFGDHAAGINNGGIDDQLAFLAAECQDESELRAWLADAFPTRRADAAPGIPVTGHGQPAPSTRRRRD